jgi:hypothetical protein
MSQQESVSPVGLDTLMLVYFAEALLFASPAISCSGTAPPEATTCTLLGPLHETSFLGNWTAILVQSDYRKYSFYYLFEYSDDA